VQLEDKICPKGEFSPGGKEPGDSEIFQLCPIPGGVDIRPVTSKSQ